MTEKMLVTQALDERDLLVKKIKSKIEKIHPVDTKNKDTKPLEVVDAYIRENTTEVIDPLGIKEIVQKMKEENEALLAELDTRIKVSNATTMIEF